MQPIDERIITEEAVPIDPGAFTEGSFEPAVNLESLKERLRSSETGQRVAAIGSAATGRPRGRPPKNKEEVKDPAKERKIKKDRTDEIADAITSTFNDTLFTFIIAQGIPQDALYMPGKGPSKNVQDERYTPNGARLAVDPFTARMVAGFLAELEQSGLAEKMGGAVGGGPVGIALKGLIAGACVVSYLNGVKQIVTEFKQIQDQVDEYKKQQVRNTDAGEVRFGNGVR